MVDRGTISRTLEKVIRTWDWSSTWGWGYPLMAMTAVRFGRVEQAVDILLMNERKNAYLPNGTITNGIRCQFICPGMAVCFTQRP